MSEVVVISGTRRRPGGLLYGPFNGRVQAWGNETLSGMNRVFRVLFTFLHGHMISPFEATNITSLPCTLSSYFCTDKKLNRNIKYFKNTMSKLDLMDIGRILHLTVMEYTISLLSRSHGTFTQIDPYWSMKKVSKHFKGLLSQRLYFLTILQLC